MLHSPPCARCDSCLVSSPIYPSTEVALRELAAAFWELRPDGQTICLACSRNAREVKPGPGVRRRRRR